MNKNKILIIGGFGFIGRNLAAQLKSNGYDVTLFGRKPKFDEQEFENFNKFYGELSEENKILEALKGNEIVFHFAGSSTPGNLLDNDPLIEIRQYVEPTISLLKMCMENNVKQFILSSSGGMVYGVPNDLPINESHPTNPISAYGINKLIIENYMSLYSRSYKTNMTTIRISNPYGPHQNTQKKQGVIGTFCHNIANNNKIRIWGDGSVTRDYIYIDDLVSALEKIISDKENVGFHKYNVGTGIGTSISELLNKLDKIVTHNIEIEYLPGRNIDIKTNILDINAFKSKFDWKQKVSLDTGLLNTYKWYLENKNLIN